MTPLHTTVVISDKPLDPLPLKPREVESPRGDDNSNQMRPYNENPGPQEENPVKDYSWNN